MQSRDIATLPLQEAIETYSPEFAAALPDNIPLKRFKRTMMTALNLNPQLVQCDRRSLFMAAVRCAQDGLYPDGREAALIPYQGKVQYQPMVHGIRKRMENSGKVASAVTEIVHKNDHFRVVKGDDPRIEHEPPALDEPRGDPIGAYAIIRLTNGEVIREVMSRSEIERIRDLYSKASRSDAPWKTNPGEMWRKTVLKRAAKQVPFSSGDERLSRLLAPYEDKAIEGDYSNVPMPTGPLPPRPGLEGQAPSNGHATDDDDDDDQDLRDDDPEYEPEYASNPDEAAEMGEKAPIDGATAAQNGEVADQLYIPFDGTSSQAWYKEARARVEVMLKQGAGRDDFERFVSDNIVALNTLKGPGPNAFRSLWQGLDRAIQQGMAQ